ncbi:MAG: hypothetical protein WDM85_03610 [Caulobacteraceae bacterium]
MLEAQYRFRLSETAGAGVRCDARGLFVGDIPLLERVGGTSWRPRRVDDLDRELSASYGLPIALEAKSRGLAATALALGNGELAKAQITALFLRLPDPPPLTKSVATASEIADLAHRLAHSGLLKREWNPDQHPRWPAGSAGGIGGEFAPAGAGNGAATNPHLTSDQGVSVPMDIPWDEPLLRPFPTEIVPPPVTGPIPRNPYPTRPECVKEWNDAEEYCARLAKQGLLGKDPYRGHGNSFEQCVRGQVSEKCGGNPVT